MKRKIHALTAMLSSLFLASFWISTVIAELFLSQTAVVQVKLYIVYSLPIFVPLMAATGATGLSMAGKGRHPLLLKKRKRMPFIAGNGLLILVPAAIFLLMRAQAGQFDFMFSSIQVVELVVGAVNLILIGLNVRDGLRLSRNR